MKRDLTQDFKFFLDKHDEILAQYPNMFVVIQDGAVVFAENTFEAAYEKVVKSGMEFGTFIIQECTAGDSAYTQFFSNQIAFA